MIVLNWIFKNGHAWSKIFDSVDHAENYTYQCAMLKDGAVDRVWIDTPTDQIWIKEKATNDH